MNDIAGRHFLLKVFLTTIWVGSFFAPWFSFPQIGGGWHTGFECVLWDLPHCVNGAIEDANLLQLFPAILICAPIFISLFIFAAWMKIIPRRFDMRLATLIVYVATLAASYLVCHFNGLRFSVYWATYAATPIAFALTKVARKPRNNNISGSESAS